MVALPATISNFNPLLANSVYDRYYLSQIWAGGLMTLGNPSNDSTHLTVNNYLNLADWYNVSADGYTYFFNLKPGLKWQDGSSITSEDVKFTYQSALTPVVGATAYATLARQLNNNSIITFPNNKTLIEFKLTSIIPRAHYAQIPYDNWLTDPTNTGTNTSVIIGSGPYEIQSYNNDIGYLSPWVDWNALYDAKFSNVPTHGVPIIQNVTIVVRNDPSTALTGLDSGELDFGDTNIGFSTVFANVTNDSNVRYINATGALFQELGLNQASPIWGLSPIKPIILLHSIPPYTDQTSKKTSLINPSNIQKTSNLIGNITNYLSPLIITGLITFSISGFSYISYQFLKYRKNMDQYQTNESFRKYLLKHLKKKKRNIKQIPSIDSSLNILEEIIEENKK